MATLSVLVTDRAMPPPEYQTVLATVSRHVRQRPSQQNRGGVSSVTVATETGFIESYMLSWGSCVGGGGRGFLTTLE